MLNKLWAGMLLTGILFGTFNGKMKEMTTAVLESSQSAVTLAVTMLGVMAFWCGLMEIASRAGILEKAAGKLQPMIHFLFPELPRNHPAVQHIATNFIANFLGLGWAATPAGLQAMEELGRLEEERRNGKAPGKRRERGVASNEMCTFLIINISSLQLIPVNVIAYRAASGSADPAWVVGPGLLATLTTTGVAVVFCKLIKNE